MLRYQLLDIEVVIKKTLIFAGLLAVSYAVVVAFACVGVLFFENIVQSKWIAMAPSILVIVFMRRPLENFLIDVTDKYLFQKNYDHRKLLEEFADEGFKILDLEKLVNFLVEKMTSAIKLDNASILLYDEETEKLKMAASTDSELSSDMEVGCTMFTAEVGRNKYILRGDYKVEKMPEIEVETEMGRLKSALTFLLAHRDGMIGILSLGKKKSDKEFTQDDINVLLPFTRAISIAIANAQLFKKLSSVQARAHQVEKMAVIGTLSAGINQEVCNPLGAARKRCEKFLTDLAEGLYKSKDPEKIAEETRDIMQKVMQETDKAVAVTRKLASFAQPTEEKKEENIKIEDEIEEVISLMERELKEHNIEVIKDISGSLPCILANRKQMQEVLFNIMDNAIHAIEKDGKISIRIFNDYKEVTVGISDTGSGIKKKYMLQIFQPFFSTRKTKKGTGLGLFIVKQIVERNNGRISVKSEPGEGAVFQLTFNSVACDERGSSENEG